MLQLISQCDNVPMNQFENFSMDNQVCEFSEANMPMIQIGNSLNNHLRIDILIVSLAY